MFSNRELAFSPYGTKQWCSNQVKIFYVCNKITLSLQGLVA